jgi:aminopeptidase-like protein
MVKGNFMKEKFKYISMMKWAKDIFPYNRSLSGDGVRKTIKYIQENVNKRFKSKKFKSNSKYFDWIAPSEWKVTEAFIKEENGKKICDINENNLHLLGYSSKFNKTVSYNQLKKNLYFLKDKPNAVPYLTSYYKKKWGFCISYNKFKKLNKNIKYRVKVNSKHFKGFLDYAEFFIKGKSKKEILIVSYICHPSMANNELSGPLVVMALSKILKSQKYSVRLILIPETIGAIAYIKKNFNHLKKNLIAGFNLSCVGDKGKFTLINSKESNTYADKVATRVLEKTKKFKKYSFLKRGSNERQFGCQNLSLPFVTICRTRFGDYKEYHTSNDNLDLISEKNLKETLKQTKLIIDDIQKNKIYVKKLFCEPFFSKYKLIRSTRMKANNFEKELFDLAAYVDKNYDETELSKLLKKSKDDVVKKLQILSQKKIIGEFY